MNIFTAKILLDDCVRHELRDHAFGDVEMVWFKGPQEIASGYFGGGNADVSLGPEINFSGEDAISLMGCGKLGHVERNDETGPDEFAFGQTMHGLRLEDVREELNNRP